MKINNPTVSFKGLWTNKTVLKSLETISEHGASFSAAVSFSMACSVRPFSIYLTPNVKKENKQYAITNSIASGIVKFALLEAIALPFEHAVKKLEKNPRIFLSKNTIKFFRDNEKNLNQSQKFKFATQFLKQSIGLLTALPKSIITVALIPILIDKLFNKSKNIKSNSVPSFKSSFSDKAAKTTGKILNNKFFQHFSEKYNSMHQDITRNMYISTDMLLTSSFALQTAKSDKIDEKCKKPLIANNALGTLASIAGGYSIDKIVKNNTKNFIKKFSEIHKNNPKLLKYIEGINILRPTVIFAFVYYAVLPMITTYISDKTEK